MPQVQSPKGLQIPSLELSTSLGWDFRICRTVTCWAASMASSETVLRLHPSTKLLVTLPTNLLDYLLRSKEAVPTDERLELASRPAEVVGGSGSAQPAISEDESIT